MHLFSILAEFFGSTGSTSDRIEEWVLQLARENRTWRYRRIAAALSNLGHEVSHQTVANVLKRHDVAPAPERGRTMSWREFIRSHVEVLAAIDFFTAEVWTAAGLMTYIRAHGGLLKFYYREAA